MAYYPKEPTTPYIDRPRFRGDVISLIQSGLTKHIILGDTHAIYGTGKTTVLAKIYYDLKAAAAPDAPEEIKSLRDRIPLWLSLDGFSIWYHNLFIQDLNSLPALRDNFDDFKKLLITLGSQIDSRAFEGLSDRLEEITGEIIDKLLSINIQAQGGNLDINPLVKAVNNDFDVGNVKIDLKIENWEIILREALKSKVNRLTQAFLKIYRSLDPQKKFVLIADDFCWIMDHPIGGWFLDLVKQLDNMVTLLSRTISEKNLDWDAQQKINLTLPSFSQEEVREYMLQRELELTDAQIEKVYRFSKAGHPLLVSLAGDLLARLDRRKAQDVDLVLDRLVGKPRGNVIPSPIDEKDLTNRIDSIITELRNDIRKYDEKLLYGLNVIALARKFDYKMLKFMFKENIKLEKKQDWDEESAEEEAEQLAHEMILRMPEYSIVEELTDRDLKLAYYRVHYIVRSRMEANLQSEPPEHIQRIHTQLVNYYQNIESENITKQEYTSMFRLEHPGFQNDVMEWLYHLFCLEDRNHAHLLLSKLFLEAFDWWGWYISSNFCEDLCNDLLVQWGNTQPDEDKKVVQLLLDFQNAYPTGYDKHGKGDWKTILRSLMNLRTILKLNLPPAQMEPDQRMVRGHLDRYIAEGYRFSAKPEYTLAETSYRSSLQYFDVRWNQAWIINYLADLNLDWMTLLETMGKVSEAHEKAASSEQLADEANQMAFEEKSYTDQDHELLSQNYRILGSVHFRQGDNARAFQDFTRSLAHAYIFHFLEDNQDEYSFQFYKDTCDQVLIALDSLVKQNGLGEAHKACETMRGFWEQPATIFGDEVFPALADDFDLDAALTSGQKDRLMQYFAPNLPEVGTIGNLIDTGVSVSAMIADSIR